MREFSIIKQKILQYLDFKGISKYKFYQETGITNGILSQSNGISEDNLLRFLSVYNDISTEWLLTGEGTMLKSTPPPEPTETPSEPHSTDLVTPLLDRIEAQARKIERLEIELANYRPSDAVGEPPRKGRD